MPTADQLSDHPSDQLNSYNVAQLQFVLSVPDTLVKDVNANLYLGPTRQIQTTSPLFTISRLHLRRQ